MTLKRNLQMVTFCQSVNKAPINAHPEIQAGIWMVGGSKIIMPEPEAVDGGNRIEVLGSEKGPEIANTEMQIRCDIRPVTYLNTILVEKFSNGR